MFQIATTSSQISTTDEPRTSSSSKNLLIIKIIWFFLNLALDRLVNRGANVVHRLAHKHNHNQPEPMDETTNKKVDSNECLTGKHNFFL